MGDQQDRHAKFLLDLPKPVQNLRLNGHVQSSRRLIRNESLGIAGESHGYHHPLPHTPRELMRIVIDTFSCIRNTHRVEQLHRPVPCLLTIKAHMETYALRQLSPNLQDRIQRRHRILKDHGYIVAPETPDRRPRHGDDILPLEHNAAVHDLAWGVGHQPHEGQCAHTLSATTLPDDSQGLALIQRVADPIYRVDYALSSKEVSLEVSNLQKNGH